jgi:phosphotransferase system enzyme I (PtsP)
MPADKGGSRALLRALRTVMAGAGDGQQRLDTVVRLVASNMVAEVCSIYLKRDERTLELCATEGLRQDAVHSARLRVGQGLVGRIAERAEPFVTDDAQTAPGFRRRAFVTCPRPARRSITPSSACRSSAWAR